MNSAKERTQGTVLVSIPSDMNRALIVSLFGQFTACEVVQATDVSETIQALRERTFDLIIITPTINPSRTHDALAILSLLYKKHNGKSPPAIVLAREADVETVKKYAKFNVVYYSVTYEPEALFEKITNALTARASMPEDVHSMNVLATISAIDNLPEPSAQHVELMRILQNPNNEEAFIKHVANFISDDPALSAAVIKIANTFLAQSARPVTIAREAVLMVGVERIGTVVRTMTMLESLPGVSEVTEIKWQDLWKHSIGVGLISQAIAGHLFPQERRKPYEYFMYGLLHDIGKIILFGYHALEFERAIIYAREHELSLHFAEQSVCLVDHAKVGEALARLWKFPAELSQVIARHHTKSELPHIQAIQLANILARALCIGKSGSFPKKDNQQVLMQSLGITADAVEKIKITVLTQIDEVAQSFRVAQ